MTDYQTSFEQLRRLTLGELDDDDVGLWSIVLRARYVGAKGPDDQGLVLRLIGDLLAEGSAIVGTPQRDGTFIAWDDQSPTAVDRIRTEWDNLHRDPNLGEVVWLTAPDRPNVVRRPRA